MKRFFLVPIFALLLAACGDSSGPGASTESFCAAMGGFSSLDAAFEDIDLSPESIEQAFEAISSQVEAAVKVAPAEISQDIETVADGIELFLDILREADFNLFALGEDAAALEDPELDAAGDRVTAYVKSECGIDLDEETSDLFEDDEVIVGTDRDPVASLEGDFDSLPEGLQDSLVESLEEALGVSPESIECLIRSSETLDAEALTEQLSGAEAFAILDKCGLDFSDFGAGALLDEDTIFDEDAFDEDLMDLTIELMADIWKTEPANVECLMNELGLTDPTEIGLSDSSVNILDLANGCGIDLAPFGFGS